MTSFLSGRPLYHVGDPFRLGKTHCTAGWLVTKDARDLSGFKPLFAVSGSYLGIWCGTGREIFGAGFNSGRKQVVLAVLSHLLHCECLSTLIGPMYLQCGLIPCRKTTDQIEFPNIGRTHGVSSTSDCILSIRYNDFGSPLVSALS